MDASENQNLVRKGENTDHAEKLACNRIEKKFRTRKNVFYRKMGN